jgi:hypothetical protein
VSFVKILKPYSFLLLKPFHQCARNFVGMTVSELANIVLLRTCKVFSPSEMKYIVLLAVYCLYFVAPFCLLFHGIFGSWNGTTIILHIILTPCISMNCEVCLRN